MKLRVKQVWNWAHTHQGRKILRFASVSVISTIVSNLVILIVLGFRFIPNEIYATVFGNVAATFPSYQLNRKWTWGKKGRSHWRNEVLPFWTMSIMGIAFSTVGAALIRRFIHEHHWQTHHHVIATVLVAGTNVVSFMIFWFLKLWIFNRIFRIDELAEVEAHLTSEEEATGAI